MSFLKFLFCVVLFALSLLFCRWLFDTVMASNLPDWLKYFILR